MQTPQQSPTSVSSRLSRTLATIVRTADLTPHMRRVTLGGEGLLPLVGNCLPADAIKLYLPEPGSPGFLPPLIPLPGLSRRYHARAYTIRRFDDDALELDVDILTHGDSPGSVWARTVQPGERIGFFAPRHEYRPVPEVDWHLLAGDEAGLSAIGAIAESLPAGARAAVFCEVDSAADELPIRTAAGVTLTWLQRRGQPACNSPLLEQALRAWAWPDGTVYCWAAGERGVMQGIRRFLLGERRLRSELVHIAGYWR